MKKTAKITGRQKIWRVCQASTGLLTSKYVSDIAGTGRRDTQHYLRQLAQAGYLFSRKLKGGKIGYVFISGTNSFPSSI